MTAIILIIHILIATALVGVVLIQRSEGGALGGLGGGNFGGLMSGRGTANLLTRTTAILAASFIGTSLVLAILAGNAQRPRSIIDTAPPAQQAVPPPVQQEPAAPVTPAQPSAPLAQ
jgi:preprotein translocase subunit SecG